MALSSVTVTGNLADYLGTDYDPRRTKMYLKTNAEKNLIADKSTGEIRLGGGKVEIAANGDFTATHWAPGADGNPQSWQTTYMIDAVDPGTRQRRQVEIGPFTVTTSGLLSALIEEQAVPAEYLTTVTAQLDTKVAAAEAFRNDAATIVGLPTEAAAQAYNIENDPTVKSAVAASIAGQAFDPSDVGYDVWILAGQSNMVGYGTGVDATYLDPPDPRIKQLASTGTHSGKVVAAVDPLFHMEQITNGVGPGMNFARRLIQQMKPNRRILLLPVALGGKGFSSTDYSWQVGGASSQVNLYANAVAQAQAALALNPKNRVAGVLWCQGEADVINGMTATTYQGHLDTLIDQFRVDLAVPTLPFVVLQMVPDYIVANANRQPIDGIHIDTPRRKTYTGFAYGPVGSANTAGDNFHYSAAGARAFDDEVWLAYRTALANATGTAPVAPTAPTATQSGTSLAVSWARQAQRVTAYEVQHRVNAGAWVATTPDPAIRKTVTLTGLTLGATIEVRVRVINETGTSAWSPTTTLTLATVPGQVTGLTAGTPTSTTQPLSWATVSGAPSYLVEYKATSSGTWLTSGTVTSASATVSGLTASTSYDYRVTATNAAGSGAPSATLTATTGATAPLVSEVGATPVAAYGLRRLRTGATFAIKVRRSSDNTTQDIGFAASSNDLDTTALLAFVGAGSGFIETWYDQSGNARDLTQTTQANQARIVNAGTLDTTNGKPCAVFDGTNDHYFRTSLGSYAANGATYLTVQRSASATTQVIAGDGSTTTQARHIAYTASGPLGFLIHNDAGSLFSATGGTATGGTLKQATATDSGTSVTGRLDGTQVYSTTYTRSGTVTVDRFAIGALFSTSATAQFLWNGGISEVVIWGTALTSTQRASGETNQKGYFGTA